MNTMASSEGFVRNGARSNAGIVVDQRLAWFVDEVLIASPLARALGVELRSLVVDHAVVVLPFKRENVSFGELVHGGIIATLIDIAGAAAAASGASIEGLRGGVTSSLSISYLAPAQGSDLRAEAIIIRRGRRQVVSDVMVSDPNGLVAKAIVTISLIRMHAHHQWESAAS